MAVGEWYDHTTYPSTGASLSSSSMRSELDTIETGISAKLPDLSGNGSKIIAVNSGASALEAITTTGTGSGVRATSPALTTPNIGAATATSINGLTITSSTGTLSITNGKTLAATASLTLGGTDGSTLNIGTGGTLGTAAYGTLGTSANNVVQLTAASKLPAVDGSLLTNLPSSTPSTVSTASFFTSQF